MDGDLLLAWMSANGRGSIRDARQRAAWLARTAGGAAGRAATGRWLRDISALGHAELDWANDRWAVTRAVITRLPNADATAVLCGSRPRQIVAVLEQTDLSVTLCPPDPAHGDLPTPTAILLQYDSCTALREAAQHIGAVYSGCAAARLAARLPRLAPGRPAPPPAHSNTSLERLADAEQIRFEPAAGMLGDGLYRMQVHGQSVHRYLHGSTWHHCDLSEGVFLSLRNRGVSAARWRPEPGPGRSNIGTFFVDFGAPLPPLHARALTLCSGLPALFSSNARTARYGNVPTVVAASVASSLCQHLQIV